jgi:hypothetical protein
MSASVKVTGARQMIANLQQLARDAPRVMKKAVYEFAQTEMTEMKRLVPVDTGALRASGHIEQPVAHADGRITCTLGFGGTAVDYAVPVHEDLEAFHRVGQAKYVEQPLAESAAHFADRVAASVKRDLGM